MKSEVPQYQSKPSWWISNISAAKNCPYLQIVLPVDNESVAEHVPHDDQVRVLTLHRNTVHAQKLREKCTAMTLHYMLWDTTQNTKSYISWALPVKFMVKVFMQWHIVHKQWTLGSIWYPVLKQAHRQNKCVFLCLHHWPTKLTWYQRCAALKLHEIWRERHANST